MRRIFLSLSLVLIAALAYGHFAAAQEMEGSVLFVAPHRLIVTPKEKSETISVSNKSTEARRYDLMLIDQIMNAQGVTQRVDKAPYSVKNMVDFRPKRFTLNPGDTQVVRVTVTRPANLADGDYHSHLLFREVPLGVKDKEKNPQPAANEKTVTFEIRTLYGIGVPIVVQQGAVASDIVMGDAEVGGSGKARTLTVNFTRTGNAEADARITAQYEGAGKKPVEVMEPQWVRIYREADKVSKKFDLTNVPDGGGKIVISLMKDESDPAKAIKKEISLK